MSALPAGVLLTSTVVVGVLLGRRYLRGERKPAMNSLHLLLGAGSLIALALSQQGLADGGDGHGWSMPKAALGLLAAAMMLGLTAQLLRRHSREVINRVLLIHAGLASLGFVIFLIWTSNP